MDSDASPDTSGARLRALTDLARALAGVHRFAEVIEVAARESQRALDASVVTLSEYVRATGELRVLINHGELHAWEEPFPADEWYARADFTRILAEEHPRPWTVQVDDFAADAGRVESLRRRGRRSCLIAPIFFAGRVWGELYAARTADRAPYGPGDLDFAATLAALVSAGLAQADRQEYLQRLAYSDELTGLANRRAVDVGLEEGIDLRALTGMPLGLIVCDVNGLKLVNDTDGHRAGDAALEFLGGQLSAAASGVEGALAARIGGDEFCVLVVGQPYAVVAGLADDVSLRAAKVPGIVGVACGYATTDGPAGPVDSRDLLFRLADAAQYEAKRSGSRTAIVAGPEHRALVEESMRAALHDALERRKIRRPR